MDEKRLTFTQKFLYFIFCAFVFNVVYNFTASYASTLDHVPSFVFGLEANIPFIPWSIIPYMTSGIFFCLVFFFCNDREQIAVLTKRMLFVTIASGIIYMQFPLKFSYEKLVVNNYLLQIPYNFLTTFDTPFNQCPSLHISYGLIFWSIFKDVKKGRLWLMIWLILMGFSTLTTYQHHLIDILIAGILVHIAFIVFVYRKNDFEYRNHQVANYYFLFGWIFILLSFLLIELVGYVGCVFIWFSILSFLIGYQYQTNNTHFLKDKNGKISMIKKVFYSPYLIVYWFFWKFLRKNRKPIEILPQVFISSRLGHEDLFQFKVDENTIIYDLSAEMEELERLRTNTNYYFTPFLDIGQLDIVETNYLVSEIINKYKILSEHQKILIHCTMGLTRSSVIGILVMKNILSLTLEEALTIMKSKNENVVIHSYLLGFFNKTIYDETIF